MILMTELGLVCVSIFGVCDMSRRNCHPPRHESPHEQRLREIVDSLVTDSSQKAAYVAFARELMAAERHALCRQPQAASHKPKAPGPNPRLGTVDWELETATKRPGSFPDYSRRTESIVAKWFARGLHGRLLWLVGQAVIQEKMW